MIHCCTRPKRISDRADAGGGGQRYEPAGADAARAAFPPSLRPRHQRGHRGAAQLWRRRYEESNLFLLKSFGQQPTAFPKYEMRNRDLREGFFLVDTLDCVPMIKELIMQVWPAAWTGRRTCGCPSRTCSSSCSTSRTGAPSSNSTTPVRS